MKWFKHDVDAGNDIRIRKLKAKFGIVGYGVFFNTLEIISRNVEKDLDFLGYLPKEWDTEALSMEFGLSPDTVGTMFDYMVEIGLFERIDGRIVNKKLAGRVDEYTQKLLAKRTKNISNVSTVSGHYPDKIPTVSPIEVDVEVEKKTTKVVGAKAPALLAGGKVLKGNNPKAYGNELVNYCLQLFKEEKGFAPIDKNPRGEAWNLVRAVRKTLTERGKPTDDEKVKRSIKQYLYWAFEESWSENIKTMSAIRRNFAVFIAKLERGEDDG